jgi:polysaccharide export outer membrane protein
MKHLVFGAMALIAGAFSAQAQDYAIQVGDTLDITVLEDANLNRQVLVRPDGRISLPLAGTIRAAGLSTTAIERVVSDAIADRFTIPPTVSVSVLSLAEPAETVAAEPVLYDVFIMGEVSAPGPKEVEPGTNLLQAFTFAGGLTPFAATKRVQLRRIGADGREQVILFNFDAIQNGAQMNSNVVLRDGDVIIVPERRLFE